MGFEEISKTKLVGGPVDYYTEITTTNLYVATVFGDAMNTITLSNDSTTDSVQASYDGATIETELKPNESVTLNVMGRNSIYLKGTAGSGKVRIWGW
jgi:hypothetical protein